MRRPLSLLEEPYRGRAVPPGSARYWSWLFADRDSRDPLLGIYALLAEWRALMDPGTAPAAAQIKLAWWQEELRRLAVGSPLHPISRYLASLPRAEAADFAPLERTVEAAARHIAGVPLQRGGQLEAHSNALRADPLLVAARLASDRSEQIGADLRGCVAALAVAEYLAAAIADFRREACCGRTVFPIDELRAAGIEDADLTAAAPSTRVQSYLDELRRRAAQSFANAADRLPRTQGVRQRHLLVLTKLGARHLRSGESAPGTNFRLRDLYCAWSAARCAARQT